MKTIEKMYVLYDMPENMPLYKDSGLWQLRTDDMDEVILQQTCEETDFDFLERCKELERNRQRHEIH